MDDGAFTYLLCAVLFHAKRPVIWHCFHQLSGTTHKSVVCWLDSEAGVTACSLSGHEFDAPVAQWGMSAWAANNCDSRHVAVLGRLFTHRGGA